MTIGTRALSLATALVLGATILGLAAEPAAAESKKPKDNGVRCSIEGDIVVSPPTENDYEYYTPGTSIEVKDGPNRNAVYECQSDGTWKQVRSQPRLPGRVPSGTFTQAP